MAQAHLAQLPGWWPGVSIVDAAIMPDQVHLLLKFGEDATVTLPRVIGRFKGLVSREARRQELVVDAALWQRGYHDRAIRNPAHVDHIRRYIRNNPMAWSVWHLRQT